jgi:hypothetical protein
MLVCFICKQDISCCIKILFRHFKTDHNLSERNSRYACCQDQCCRTFCSKYGFKRHVETFHAKDLNGSVTTVVQQPGQDTLTVARSCSSGEFAVDSQVTDGLELQDGPIHSSEAISELACRFLFQAKRQVTTLENVNKMVDACSEIVQTVVSDLQYDFEALRSSPSEAAWESLHRKFLGYADPFQGLKNQFQQTKFAKNLGVYVQPEEYLISRCQSFVTDRQTGFVKPYLQKVTGQHVSIKSMILALNLHTDLVQKAVSLPLRENDGMLKSFFCGSHWSSHPLCKTNVLVLRLYGDDFEPANPLGSHRCLYKIGCIYYQLENLPSFMQSKTDNIFLTLCYHTEDVKNFSWTAVLKPLVQELKVLESEGIDIMVNGSLVNNKVLISCITGDNLFLHRLLGFVESFTASYPCRHCTIRRTDFQHRTVEVFDEVRTVSNYDEAVTTGCVQDSGVKERSVLNELSYFHASLNHVQDLMHNILEGICSYDLRLLCKALTNDGVSLHMLNSRMQSVDLGYHDVSSRPPVISSLENEVLSFEAAEMWCFTRYLPVAIGNLVHVDNHFWLMYLKLREIMDILFAPQIQSQELELLKIIICEYLEMRNSLFPTQSMKNKHHHLIHYLRLIAAMGPMSRYWCMRFETEASAL